MIAAFAVIWLTAAARNVVNKSVPSVLIISGLVLTVQAAMVLATDQPTRRGLLCKSRINKLPVSAAGGIDCRAASGCRSRHPAG
jgi:hypothetical protein